MKSQQKFVLQFGPAEIDALAKRYGSEQDDKAFEAVRSLALGNYSKAALKVIALWKSPRRAALIGRE